MHFASDNRPGKARKSTNRWSGCSVLHCIAATQARAQGHEQGSLFRDLHSLGRSKPMLSGSCQQIHMIKSAHMQNNGAALTVKGYAVKQPILLPCVGVKSYSGSLCRTHMVCAFENAPCSQPRQVSNAAVNTYMAVYPDGVMYRRVVDCWLRRRRNAVVGDSPVRSFAVSSRRATNQLFA
jgi:hypothetical protein